MHYELIELGISLLELSLVRVHACLYHYFTLGDQSRAKRLRPDKSRRSRGSCPAGFIQTRSSRINPIERLLIVRRLAGASHD